MGLPEPACHGNVEHRTLSRATLEKEVIDAAASLCSLRKRSEASHSGQLFQPSRPMGEKGKKMAGNSLYLDKLLTIKV